MWDNSTGAQPEWFVDEATGDLHLLPSAGAAMDQLDRLEDCGDDYDGVVRPASPSTVDLGADEVEAPIFVDGFESGDVSWWSGASGVP